MNIATEVFATEKYKASMAKCFIEAGQFPEADGTFVKYTNHNKGKILKSLLPESAPEDEEAMLATLTVDIEVGAIDSEPESEEEGEPMMEEEEHNQKADYLPAT